MDPLQGYTFTVQVDGTPLPSFIGQFTSVSGIGAEYTVMEHKTFNSETGLPLVQYMPGRPRFTPITFKRGLTQEMSFWLWHAAVANAQGSWTRALVTVTLKNRKYEDILSFQLVNAWPSKISEATFDATRGDEFIIEELTFQYEQLIMDPVSTLTPSELPQ